MAYGEPSWAQIRLSILDRDDWTCRYCGDSAHHVDHMLPRSRGGTDDEWNLVAACEYCNLSKHAKVYDWAVANTVRHQTAMDNRHAAVIEAFEYEMEWRRYEQYLDTEAWLDTELAA